MVGIGFTDFTKHRVYPILARAAENGKFRYQSGEDPELGGWVRSTYPKLKEAKVVPTVLIDAVADHAAGLMVERLRKYKENGAAVVNVGFSGGYSMRRVCEALGYRLSNWIPGFPEKVVFHALAVGFDNKAVGADPTGFFTYLDAPAVRANVNIDFRLLQAPPVVTPRERDELLKRRWVSELLQPGINFHLIVTSADSFKHQHSMLRCFYNDFSPSDKVRLETRGCIGDMLWIPLSPHGPIDTRDFDYLPMTRVDLDHFRSHIEAGQDVLLVVGPCGADPSCKERKSEPLRVILEQGLATHLAVDSATIRGIVP